MVSLGGGYVRDWVEEKRSFEMIVGRSMPEDRAARYLGLVYGYDRKPKRRLVDVLKSQGLQANQDDHVPDRRRRGSARAHGADQPVRRTCLLTRTTSRCGSRCSASTPDVAQHHEQAGSRLLDDLQRIKWLLWHGNTYRVRDGDRQLRGPTRRIGGAVCEPTQVRHGSSRVRCLHRRQCRQLDQLR